MKRKNIARAAWIAVAVASVSSGAAFGLPMLDETQPKLNTTQRLLTDQEISDYVPGLEVKVSESGHEYKLLGSVYPGSNDLIRIDSVQTKNGRAGFAIYASDASLAELKKKREADPSCSRCDSISQVFGSKVTLNPNDDAELVVFSRIAGRDEQSEAAGKFIALKNGLGDAVKHESEAKRKAAVLAEKAKKDEDEKKKNDETIKRLKSDIESTKGCSDAECLETRIKNIQELEAIYAASNDINALNAFLKEKGIDRNKTEFDRQYAALRENLCDNPKKSMEAIGRLAKKISYSPEEISLTLEETARCPRTKSEEGELSDKDYALMDDLLKKGKDIAAKLYKDEDKRTEKERWDDMRLALQTDRDRQDQAKLETARKTRNWKEANRLNNRLAKSYQKQRERAYSSNDQFTARLLEQNLMQLQQAQAKAHQDEQYRVFCAQMAAMGAQCQLPQQQQAAPSSVLPATQTVAQPTSLIGIPGMTTTQPQPQTQQAGQVPAGALAPMTLPGMLGATF